MLHANKKQWDDSHLEESASCCAKKRKASGELESLNEQHGAYDDFWGYIRIGLKLKKRNKRKEKVSESEQKRASGEDLMILLLWLTKGPGLIKP